MILILTVILLLAGAGLNYGLNHKRTLSCANGSYDPRDERLCR